MKNQKLVSMGSIATIIGGIITVFAYNKFSSANGMIKTLNDGDLLFGTNSDNSLNIWINQSNNYKIMLIIGSIVLIVGLILLLSGFINKKNEYNINQTENDNNNSIQLKLQELEQIYKNNLITQEEYDTKRKEIINKL